MKIDFKTAAIKRALQDALIPAAAPNGGDPAKANAWHFTRGLIDHMAIGAIPNEGAIRNGMVTQRRYQVATDGPLYSQIAKNMTVGFELETQSTNGVQCNNIPSLCQEWNNNRPIDDAAYQAAINDRATALMSSPDFYTNGNLGDLMKPVWQQLLWEVYVEQNRAADPDSVEAASGEATKKLFFEKTAPKTTAELMERTIFLHNVQVQPAKVAEILGEEAAAPLRARAIATATQQTRRDQYLVGGRLDENTFRQRRILPQIPGRELLDVGTDGTVRGFEIRTVGALTIPNFMRALDVVFAPGVTHAVDIGCSFHLHIGLTSGKLPYSAKVQAAMYEYLLMNIDKVPEKVRTRWSTLATGGTSGSGREASQYFRLDLHHTKYTFVNSHGLGTWEFRCFGNVDNKKDALACLRLAIGAMRYAAQVASNDKALECFPQNVAQGALPGSLHQQCMECITKKIPLNLLTADRKVAAKKMKERKAT